ncbi:hypothetical protein P12x_000076 [Tundrisphaera lichenicola]|uniref:hypothetical protein n=1 Tax=Tundrisphaera lichenicola TaxID=2029860 RepID=UPI003EB6B7D9
MRRFRMSIAGLLGLVALMGVAIAALTHPSPLAGNAYYTITLAALIIAVLAAVYHRGGKRAFWVGFSTCGWAYFLLVFGPAWVQPYGQNLVTTTLLDIVYPYTIPSKAGVATLDPAGIPVSWSKLAGFRASGRGARVILAGGFAGGPVGPLPSPWEILTTPDRTTRFWPESPETFRRIGHSLFCLAFATIGGFLTRRFRMTQDPT